LDEKQNGSRAPLVVRFGKGEFFTQQSTGFALRKERPEGAYEKELENRENDEARSLGKSRKGFVFPFAIGGDQKSGQNKSLHDEGKKRRGYLGAKKGNVLPKIDHVILPSVIVIIEIFQRDEFGKHLSEISREDGQEGEKRDACLAEGRKKDVKSQHDDAGNPGSGRGLGTTKPMTWAVKW